MPSQLPCVSHLIAMGSKPEKASIGCSIHGAMYKILLRGALLLKYGITPVDYLQQWLSFDGSSPVTEWRRSTHEHDALCRWTYSLCSSYLRSAHTFGIHALPGCKGRAGSRTVLALTRSGDTDHTNA